MIYPNPGPGPVQVQINLAQASNDLVVSVFSTAFRKVNEIHYGPKTAGLITLTLVGIDEWNIPLANGLYYVVVRAPQGLLIGKWVVLR